MMMYIWSKYIFLKAIHHNQTTKSQASNKLKAPYYHRKQKLSTALYYVHIWRTEGRHFSPEELLICTNWTEIISTILRESPFICKQNIAFLRTNKKVYLTENLTATIYFFFPIFLIHSYFHSSFHLNILDVSEELSDFLHIFKYIVNRCLTLPGHTSEIFNSERTIIRMPSIAVQVVQSPH